MRLIHSISVYVILVFVLSACASSQASDMSVTAPATPAWFDMELTDVQTGETFTMNNYAGKVVLLETMTLWCATCIIQANQVKELHETLRDPEDLISISLDVDIHDDGAALKEYASEYGFDWRFAIASLDVAHELGNLYTPQYFNAPLSPMLIIDRSGNVHHLEYGVKDVETLQKAVEPYLKE